MCCVCWHIQTSENCLQVWKLDGGIMCMYPSYTSIYQHVQSYDCIWRYMSGYQGVRIPDGYRVATDTRIPKKMIVFNLLNRCGMVGVGLGELKKWIEHEKRILLAVQITNELVVFLGIRTETSCESDQHGAWRLCYESPKNKFFLSKLSEANSYHTTSIQRN